MLILCIQMSMSVQKELPSAPTMQLVLIPLAHTHAPAKMATVETVLLVMVSDSATYLF